MALQRRSTFGSWDVEKVHGVVARSTFGRQHVNIHTFGQLLEVEMLKKCTPLWREARSEAKPLKKSTEVETLKQCTPLWHDSHLEIKITSGSEHFWKLWCSKKVCAVVVGSTFRSQNMKSTMLGPLLEVEMSRCCGAKHISKSTCAKHIMFGLLLKDVCVAGAKWAKREGFLALAKTMAGAGRLKRVWTTLY